MPYLGWPSGADLQQKHSALIDGLEMVALGQAIHNPVTLAR